MKQLELMPRPRVRLEDPVAGPNVQTMEFPPDKELELIPDPFLERSAWSKDGEKPPTPGCWEVTDHRTGALLARWWFGGVWWLKVADPRLDKNPVMLSHDRFVESYAWRGLRSPHPDVYQCPPYVSTDLVLRAQEAGVGINTTYVRIRPGARPQTMPAPRVVISSPMRQRARL